MPRKNKKEYNQYMRKFMQDYRKQERELLRKAKQQFGWNKKKRGKKHGK